jgi:hypothetical protein
VPPSLNASRASSADLALTKASEAAARRRINASPTCLIGSGDRHDLIQHSRGHSLAYIPSKITSLLGACACAIPARALADQNGGRRRSPHPLRRQVPAAVETRGRPVAAIAAAGTMRQMARITAQCVRTDGGKVSRR